MAEDINRPTSDDLETSYSEMFGLLIEKLNTEYLRLLREVLAEENRENSLRYNAFSFKQFREKIFGIDKRIDKGKIFGNVFKAMGSVFATIDSRITKSITKDFEKNKFPVPEVTLKKPSVALKSAINLNTDLITTITSKQSELLANTVQQAVSGQKNFADIIKQVEAQADKGKKYAEFVARDQAAKAYADIAEERQKSAGYPNFEWVCVNIPPTPAKKKGEVRPDHWKLNKQIFAWTHPPKIKGRETTPGHDVNCRCKAKGTFRPVTGGAK